MAQTHTPPENPLAILKGSVIDLSIEELSQHFIKLGLIEQNLVCFDERDFLPLLDLVRAMRIEIATEAVTRAPEDAKETLARSIIILDRALHSGAHEELMA